MDNELEAIRKRKMEELKSSLEANNYPDKPIIIEDNTFDHFIKKYPFVVIDCWAPWCGPCRMLAPVIDSIAAQMKGKVVFGKLDTDKNLITAQKKNIVSIPTLLIYKNGKLIDTITGAIPEKILFRRLNSYINENKEF